MIMMVGIPILRSTKISEFLTFNLSIFVKISKKDMVVMHDWKSQIKIFQCHYNIDMSFLIRRRPANDRLIVYK